MRGATKEDDARPRLRLADVMPQLRQTRTPGLYTRELSGGLVALASRPSSLARALSSSLRCTPLPERRRYALQPILSDSCPMGLPQVMPRVASLVADYGLEHAGVDSPLMERGLDSDDLTTLVKLLGLLDTTCYLIAT